MKTKQTSKLIALIMSASMLIASMGMTAMADEITMTPDIADGAANVPVSTSSIKLSFDDLVDDSTFNSTTVTVNGEGVTKVEYDDMNPFDITVKFNEALEAGTRYVVRVDGVTVGDDTDFSAVTRFTTEFVAKEMPLADFSTYGTPGSAYGGSGSASGGILTYTATAANNGIYISGTNVNLHSENYKKMIMRAKSNIDTKAYFYYRTMSYQNESDSQRVDFVIPGDGEWHNIEVDMTGKPLGGVRWGARISLSTLATVNVDYINVVPLPTHEMVKYYDFYNSQDYYTHGTESVTTTKDDKGLIVDVAEGKTGKVFSNSVDVKLGTVNKVVVRAKKLTAADTNLDLYLFTGWYNYVVLVPMKRFALTDEYVDYVYDLSSYVERQYEAGTAIKQMALWSNNDFQVYSINFVPYDYQESIYKLGSLQTISNFGTDEEKVVTTPEEGSMSAVLTNIYNATANEKNIILINALYDNSGALADVAIARKVLNSKSYLSEPLTATIENVPAECDGYTVKSFLWEDGIMRPIK